MIKNLFLIGSTSLLLATSALAQYGPGWFDTSDSTNGNFQLFSTESVQRTFPKASSVRRLAAKHGKPVSTKLASASTSQGILLSSSSCDSPAESVTPEIAELARGLLNDPMRIFEYVHNQIQYEQYFGIKKGAQLTLLEGRGNDMDQSALLAALLRAAGYEARYEMGYTWVPYESQDGNDLQHWLGITATNTNINDTSGVVGQFLQRRGLYYQWIANWDGTNTSSLEFEIVRMWVQADIGTNTYRLDPSFKTYDDITSGVDVVESSGVSVSNLLVAAGGVDDGTSVSNLNEEALGVQLSAYTMTLVSNIHDSFSDEEPLDFMGGRKLRKEYLSDWVDAFPLNVTSNTVVTDCLPLEDYGVYFGLEVADGTTYIGSVDLFTAELQGRRLSVTFDEPGMCQIWLDDTLLSEHENATTNATVELYAYITHPHWYSPATYFPPDPDNFPYWYPPTGGLQHGQDITSDVPRSTTNGPASYVVMCGFSPSERLIDWRRKQLDIYLSAEDSHEITCETANLVGLDWLVQTDLSGRMVAQQEGVLFFFHHRLGIVGQEQGSYVDVPGQLSSYFRPDGSSWEYRRMLFVDGMFNSAMEHGVIEQRQPGMSAASSVQILHLANAQSDPIFRADWENWDSVRAQLTNYDEATLDDIEGNIDEFHLYGGDAVYYLPRDGQVPLNDWSGMGYVASLFSDYGDGVGFVISGGYSGGYMGTQGPFDPVPIHDQIWWDPSRLGDVPSGTPRTRGADPVSLASGAFDFSRADLACGNAEPRGLSFVRSYNSERRFVNPAKLGYGWTHNYHIQANETTDYRAALGHATPYELAAYLVACRAGLDMFDAGDGPKERVVLALIARWAAEQLKGNAVSITLGNDTVEFIRQPDGSYTPPAGLKLELLKTNGVYEMYQRHANIFRFNTNGTLAEIEDPYGKKALFSYDAGRLDTVTDAYDRTVEFGYNANSQLTTVTETAGSLTRAIQFDYDSYGNLTNVVDPELGESHYDCDSEHQILATYDALGRMVTTNIFDSLGRVMEQQTEGDSNKTWLLYYAGIQSVEEDPLGNRTWHFFDDRNREIGVQDALGNISSLLYDGQNRIVETVSPMYETNQFVYDAEQNLTLSIDPLNYTNRFYYDDGFHLRIGVDARGNTNTFGYNAYHQITGQTNGAGDWVTFAYDSTAGTLSTRTDPGGTTSFGYDGWGQLDEITYPSGLGSETFQNNPRGDVTNHINPRNFSTAFQYSQRRELTNTIAPTNLTAKIRFDAVGNIASTTDARGFSISNAWSATRRLLSTTLPATPQGVPVVTNIYDNRDWLTKTIDPLLSEISYTNDSVGRLASVTDPLQRSMRFSYDADGRRLAATNAALEVTRQVWNGRGELTEAVDGASNTVHYVHDATGNQVTLTNRNGKRWQFQYDEANRLTNTVTPLGRETQVSFNQRGLVSTMREPSLQTRTNLYDVRGRLTNVTDLVSVRQYGYDANNNLTNIVQDGKTNSWIYDAYDHIQVYRDTDGNLIQYRYDENGNLTNLVYPGNRNVFYAYDSLNRVTNVTDWSDRETAIEYDLAGRVRKITRPNLTTREVEYDAAGQTTNIIEKTAAGLPLAYCQLNWNDAARVEWEFVAPLPHAYTPPTRTMTFDDDNRIATFNGSNVVHDDDGNMTSGPLTNSTLVSYSYNARNQLLDVGGISAAYDAVGNRIALTNGASVTRFVVDPNAALSQVLVRVGESATNYYIYGPGLLYEITETAAGVKTLTYHYDYRGSTVALTDDNGNVTDRMEYSAYGTLSYRAGTNDVPFLFNGRYGVQTDPDGLLYMRARYYNPYLCRFINADPAGFAGGLNFYAYADGNPVSYLDPFGLGAEEPNSSTWDLWWLNMYNNAPMSSERIARRLAQHGESAVQSLLGFYQNIFDPFGFFGDNAIEHAVNSYNQIADTGYRAGEIYYEPDARRQFYSYLTSEEGVVDATILLESIIATAKRPSACFSAGTKISTPCGDRNIEDIEVGDMVYAYDFDSQAVVEREVLEVAQNFTYFWAEVAIGDEVIHATRGHQFWVESTQEWVEAASLKPGMTMRLENGQLAQVKVVTIHELDEPETTYNLVVNDEHNYFVGQEGVLVHNGLSTGNPLFNGEPGPSPALDNNPWSPANVDARRSEWRRALGAPSIDPDSPIPDQGPGRDVGGHSASKGTPHSTGERNVNPYEEHSRRAKGGYGRAKGGC